MSRYPACPILAAAMLVASTPAALAAGKTQRVTVGSAGQQADSVSESPKPTFPRWARSALEKQPFRLPLVNRGVYLTTAPSCKEPLDPDPQANPGCSGASGRSGRIALP